MRNHKKYLFAFILLILLASPVMRIVGSIFPISIAPLKGYVTYAHKPEFNRADWFSGKYQLQYDKYTEDHIGLRNALVRTYNQIDFSLFRKANAAHVIIGKEDYLYELNYIKSYMGTDFIGEEAISNKSQKVKAVQDTLSKLGTELIVFFAPGKASFYPEYIPDRYLQEEAGKTNNQAYTDCFDSLGVDYINFRDYFVELKDTSRYMLFPKCGIHWTRYGANLALDSIIRYIESKKGIDMVDRSYEGIELSESPRFSDYDVGEGLNLIFHIPDGPKKYPYPFGYKYEMQGKVKPDIMVIADSYYWTIYNIHNSKVIWGEQDFRYYNSAVYTPDVPEQELAPLTYEELSRFDVILIMYTDANMYKFANNFFEDAYLNLYYNHKLKQYQNSIRNSEDWLEQVKEKAERKGVSTEEMIAMDARWMVEREIEQEMNKDKE